MTSNLHKKVTFSCVVPDGEGGVGCSVSSSCVVPGSGGEGGVGCSVSSSSCVVPGSGGEGGVGCSVSSSCVVPGSAGEGGVDCSVSSSCVVPGSAGEGGVVVLFHHLAVLFQAVQVKVELLFCFIILLCCSRQCR